MKNCVNIFPKATRISPTRGDEIRVVDSFSFDDSSMVMISSRT